MDRTPPSPLPLAPGRPWPMGVSYDGQGINIAVFSAHALAIELCLFDADGRTETHRGSLPGRTQEKQRTDDPTRLPNISKPMGSC